MDVTVVGAGVVGCATAWELVRRGHRVVVLEARGVASGASGGVGERGVRANCRDEAELPLAALAQELWPDLDRRLGAPTGYRRVGHLQLIERDEDVDAAEVIERRQNERGVECAIVSGAALRAMEPSLSPAVVAAIFAPGDGVADHTATTRAFARAASGLGAEIREGVTVRSVRVEAGVATTLDTDEGVVPAGDVVVVAANGGAKRLFPELPLFDVFPQVLVTEPLGRTVVRHLIGHMERRLALKTLPSGAVMITGGRLGRDGAVVPEEVEANVADAVAVFPSLEGAVLETAVADRAESATPDLLPVLDRVGSNTLVATGWTGHGWAIAPAVADELADAVETGGMPEVLRPFSASRFAGRDIS